MASKTAAAMQRTLAIVNDCSALGAREPLPPNFFLRGPEEHALCFVEQNMPGCGLVRPPMTLKEKGAFFGAAYGGSRGL